MQMQTVKVKTFIWSLVLEMQKIANEASRMRSSNVKIIAMPSETIVHFLSKNIYKVSQIKCVNKQL